MHRLIVVIMCLCTPTFASDPGEPLDCSDWTILEPGLSCSEFISDCVRTEAEIGNTTSVHDPLCFNSQGTAIDMEGGLYRMRLRPLGSGTCNGGDNPRMNRLELLRSTGGPAEVVAYLDSRCNADGTIDAVSVTDNLDMRIHPFDNANGRVLFSVSSECYGAVNGIDCSPGYPGKYWVAAISGFATTFDVLQSFTPSAAGLEFRVPYMPEGLPAASWFDSYWGNLESVGDWSQAQPLQCGYPSAAPTVGDYLEVADWTPTPDPGTGHYYVTAASYQGVRRFGRRGSGGEFTGRDPQALPDCVESQHPR